jgi:hypothetical protein
MRLWNTGRAALYGALTGIAAAAFRSFAPFYGSSAEPHSLVAVVKEFAGAGLAFALLCAGAAALRNLIVRRLIEPDVG